MLEILRNLRAHPMFRTALIVPTSIMLIFSVFNLTAPPDPARQGLRFSWGPLIRTRGASFPPSMYLKKC